MSEDSQNKPAPPPQQAHPVLKNPVQPPMGAIPLSSGAEVRMPSREEFERAFQNNEGGGK